MVNEKKEELQVEELLQKYDLETSRLRSPVGIAATLIFIIAVAMSAFHLYTAGFGILQAMKQRAVHLSFAFLLVFLLYPMTKGGTRARFPSMITCWPSWAYPLASISWPITINWCCGPGPQLRWTWLWVS